MTLATFRRRSNAISQDVSHLFAHILRPLRRNVFNIHYELAWPFHRRLDLIVRHPSAATISDDRRLWIWEFTWVITITRTDGCWEIQRSEYITCPRRTNHRDRNDPVVLFFKAVLLSDAAVVGWCIARA